LKLDKESASLANAKKEKKKKPGCRAWNQKRTEKKKKCNSDGEIEQRFGMLRR
jgi:hypothetical protein